MNEELTAEARRRAKIKWPFLDNVLLEGLTELMVQFHLDMSKGHALPSPDQTGMLLSDFMANYNIDDRSRFRIMLRHLVAQGLVDAWKEGRQWVIAEKSREYLIKSWATWKEARR